MKPALALAAVLLAVTLPATAETNMGIISFPNSGNAAAQPHFIRGVLSLHNFWFEEAEEAFQKAQQADPSLALAYWGEAMSHNHPLWAEQDMSAARKVLEKLGASRAARLAKAKTDREKAYMDAIETLYGEGDKLQRDRAYSKVMAGIAERYPDDNEAKVLYALSLLGTVRPGDKGFARQMKSAALLAGLKGMNPQHPGVAHFTIHSFDDPEHAPLALEAADVYAKVAPEAPHALHMPSHIFIQLGMWDRVVASNEAAYAASVKWVDAKKLSLAKRDFHSLEWGQYGDLQRGQYAKAKGLIPQVEEVAAKTGDARATGAKITMYARYVVESRRWEDLPLAELPAPGSAPVGMRVDAVYGSRANQLSAAGFSAAHMGNAAKVAEAVARLRAIEKARKEQGTAYDGRGLAIMATQLEGLSTFLTGDKEAGLAQVAEAVKIEEALDPPSGPTNPLKPSHELYGELLLAAGRPADAQKAFETALQRMPKRSLSLLGLARAARKAGDAATAAEAYEQLATNWAGADAGADIDEVRGFRATEMAAGPAGR